MELSVVMPFLNSDEIVRRTIKYWGRMDLPDDIEFLIMDDGSEKPLRHPKFGLLDLVTKLGLNLEIHETNEFRPWTSSAARNMAARSIAKGRNLFLVDGDYIVSREALERARVFRGDRLGCRRHFGVLLEDGTFTQDHKVLIEWGLNQSRIRARGTRIPPHPNQFIMRRELFLEMGGYDEYRIFNSTYPQREDNDFKRRTRQWERNGKLVWSEEERPTLFMYPNGQFCGDVDYNPFNLFHTLTRKTNRNYWYHHMRYERAE